MRISNVFLPLAVAAMLAGCSNNQDPAVESVTQAEAALEGLRADASQFAQQELQASEATLAAMKADLAKEDYNAVLTHVPKFNAEVKALQGAMVTNQTMAAAAQNEWEMLNSEVPKTVEAIQVRLNALTGSRLPREITRQTFDTAKAEFETMKTTWAEATAAAAAGDSVQATDKGRAVQAKGEELKVQLGMSSSLAATAPASDAPSLN